MVDIRKIDSHRGWWPPAGALRHRAYSMIVPFRTGPIFCWNVEATPFVGEGVGEYAE